MLTIGRARTVRFGNGKGLRLGTGGGSGPSNTLDLIVIGDSISTVSGGVSGGYLIEAQTYPEVLKALIESREGVTVNLQRIAEGGKSFNYNYLGGQTLNQMVMDPASAASTLPAGRRADAKIIIFAGTNGLALAGNSGATEYTGFAACFDYLIGQGYAASNVSVVTCLPRNQGSPFETNRQDFNSLIKADAGARGYRQVRVDESLGFNDANDNSGYLFQPDFPNSDTNGRDQIHIGWVGHKVLACFCYDGGHYAGGVYPSAVFDPVLHLPSPLVFDPANYNATTGNWPSKAGSASAVTLAQATSSLRPTAGTLNGLPAVEFSNGGSAATRQFLRALATGYTSGQPLLNCVTAYFADAYSANSFIYNFGDAAAGWDTGPMLKNNGSTWNGRANPDTAGPHVITALHGTINASQMANNLAFIDNQWQQTTDNHLTQGMPAQIATDLTVGGANQYGVNFGGLDGRMGELIFWKPPEPNDYWVHRVQRYLKEKYGTP